MYSFHLKTLKKENIDIVIYHHPCTDGYTSAMIAHRFLKNREVLYCPLNYGYDSNVLPDFTNKHVLICDFSFPKQVFDMIYEKTKGNVLILDHHKTAMNQLQEVPDNNKVFDMNHCGAYITWTYFYGYTDIPKMIYYVEDNDLWIKKLYKTKEFTTYINSKQFIFEEFEIFLDNKYIETVVFAEGAGMQIQNDLYASNLVKKAIPKFTKIGDSYYFITYLNSNILKSELGNRVFNEFPNCNFSAIYSQNQYKNETSFSLRSEDNRTDVSNIATLYKGGGHRNASGLIIGTITDILPGRVIDHYQLYFILDNLYIKEILVEESKYKILMLNCPFYKKHILNYLCQTRYCKNGENITEGQAIIKQKYDGTAVWNYTGKQYEISCRFDKLLQNKIRNYFGAKCEYIENIDILKIKDSDTNILLT